MTRKEQDYNSAGKHVQKKGGRDGRVGAEGVGGGRDFQGFNPRRRIPLFNISVPYCRYFTFVDEVLILSFFL